MSRQVLRRAEEIEGVADTGRGPIQQGESLLGPVTVCDIDDRARHPQGTPLRALQPVFMPGTYRHQHIANRPAGVQHPADHVLNGVRLRDVKAPEYVDEPASEVPRLTRRLLDAYAHEVLAPADAPAAKDSRPATLSDREREVLVAIGQGWTNTEIAERLVLTESTVKKHVGRVLAKLGARDRIQAVIMAYDAGLVRTKS